jgi:eukaryotic-like serine/threonine-protein kinase
MPGRSEGAFMNCCPSRNELQQLVAEQLNGEWREALEIHVERCPACQDALAHLSDEDEVGHTQVVRASCPTPLPASELDFVEHLKENPPWSEEAAFPPDESAPENIEFPGPPTEKGPLGQLGCFAIRKELGAGRYGVVYQAYDELDRLVALKILRPEFAASCQERARFEREGRKAAAVKHDHIVTIHQVGHTPGFALPYLVMEYVDGEALSERLHRHRVVPAREAACIVRQMALALSAAHTQGFVHRDVKPSNILLEAGTGRAKLTDFGLARMMEAANASTNGSGRAGTAPYMSPEHINAPRSVDGRSDVYSLGVTLYELLTGDRPFRAVRRQLWQEIIHDEPRPPRKLNDAIARDLETITLKCLAKEPDRRYQSAGVLADDLQRWLDGKPIEARPVSMPGKAWRWCRRNPSQAAAAVLAVIALMAATAFSLSVYFIMKLNAEKQRADRLSSQLALEGGLSLCEQGEIDRGLFRWANSLKIAPDEDPDFKRLIRGNLAGWSRQISPLKQVLQHQREVVAVGFTPDGKTILTGSGREIHKWDADTGKAMGHPIRYQGMVFALSPDGRTVLIRMDIGESAQLVETDTGKAIGLPLHQQFLLAAAFSPDGNIVCTGGTDNTARLWQVATGKSLGPPLAHKMPVKAVAVAPDGKTVLTGSVDGTAQLWDGIAGKPLGLPFKHKNAVYAVAFSPDGTTVLTGSDDKTAQLWDVALRTPIGPPIHLAGKAISLAFSPDGQIVCISEDIRCRLWSTSSGKPLGPPLPHPGTVNKVCFGPEGKKILTAGADRTARLWEAASAKAAGHVLPHGARVYVAVFSPDGQTVWTGSADGAVRVWDVASGKLLHSLEHRGAVRAIAVSPDRKTIVTGSWDGTAKLWEVATGKTLHSLQHDDRVLAVAFSPEGNDVVTGSANGTVRVWDVDTGKLRLTLREHSKAVYAVGYSPDGKTLLSGSADSTARLWDARTGIPVGPPLQHQKWIYAAVFSPDGKTVLTGSADGTAQLWDAHTGQPLGPPLKHFGMVFSAVFSPDGKSVLTGSADTTAQLWDAHTGQPLGPPLKHQGEVRTVAFSPDGRLILTGSDDEAAQLWDTTTGKAFGPPFPHPALIDTVAFGPDGRTALTGGEDNVARLWEVPVPIEGTREQIVLWMKVITGMDIGDDGSVRIMDAKIWQESRQLLANQADLTKSVRR